MTREGRPLGPLPSRGVLELEREREREFFERSESRCFEEMGGRIALILRKYRSRLRGSFGFFYERFGVGFKRIFLS